MSVQLTIVIVNWNGGELLRRCLESIQRHPPAVPFEVVLVDNASSDGSVAHAESLGASFPIAILRNEENLGFGRANNQAFAQSRAPLQFLLNPDAELREGAVDRLVATLNEHPEAGACAPRLVHADGSLQPTVWPNPLTPLHIVLAGTGLWRLLPRKLRGTLLFADHWTYDRLRAVPMVSGAAMLVRRRVIEEVGGFDERFAMYAEDNEWCLRMRRAGWQIVLDPRATVMHHGGALSLTRWGELGKLRVQTAEMLRFQRMSLSRVHRIANVVALAAVSAVRYASRRVRGQRDDAAAAVLKLCLEDLRRGPGVDGPPL
jgi:N-acetylglucosaminyl-diphospho-decaprenol L-rhamnosyltransferase